MGRWIYAAMAQMVEHILGKDEVTGSSPVSGTSLMVARKPFIYRGLRAFSFSRIVPKLKYP